MTTQHPGAMRLDDPYYWEPSGEGLVRTYSTSDIDVLVPYIGEPVRATDASGLSGASINSVGVAGLGGDAVIAAIGHLRTPAEGLEPASLEAKLFTIDPRTLSALEVVSLGAVEIDAIGGIVTGTERVVATSFGGAAYGYNVDTGAEIWRHAGRVRGIRADGVLIQNDGGSGCGELISVDLATGSERWRHPDACWEDEDAGRRYLSLSDTELDLQTGRSVTLEIDLADETSDLVVSKPPDGYYETAPWIVLDASTGAEVFRVSGEDVDALGLDILAIAGEVLYANTTDQSVRLNARTGESLGEWFEYPIVRAGRWTLLSEGGFEPDDDVFFVFGGDS